MLSSYHDLEISEGVYPPSEDTELLLESMKIHSGERVLDMGTGSGILAIEAARRGGVVTAADISETALECSQKNAERNGVEIQCILSDLFENVNGAFDVILFNPPYLPKEDWSSREKGDRTWDGGGDGSETVREFVSQLPRHLKGRCYLLFSSLTGKGRETVHELLKDRFIFKECASKKLFFENVYVYELQMSGNMQ